MFRAGERCALVVVASMARGDQVVEPIVTTVAPGDEGIYLSSDTDPPVAVEAVAVLQIEQARGDPVQRGAVPPEQELFELDDGLRGLDVGVELCCLVGPPARDERPQQRPKR